MLNILGRLSRLFSTAEEPFLYYRAHENVFAKYFNVSHNARSDDSADAYDRESGVGIGLKTWVGQDNQKVAEFGRLRPSYAHLEGLELVRQIAVYRNARIRTTMNAHGLHRMMYHVVKRVPGAMRIYETRYDFIDIEKIILDEKRGGKNTVYFSDGRHTYHFNRAKNTLFMIFDEMELMDEIEVSIVEDPYELLATLFKKQDQNVQETLKPALFDWSIPKEQLCLRLYSTKPNGEKYVAPKSGLNQWNGERRAYRRDEKTGQRHCVKRTPRDPNELYIPYPSVDRKRKEFFPPRDCAFDLLLPDGQWIKAKVCQQDSKAIMSNPNHLLGKWLLRDVFELPEGCVVTYDMLKVFGVDSVMFTKISEGKYTVDFCELGTYEAFYGIEDQEEMPGEPKK